MPSYDVVGALKELFSWGKEREKTHNTRYYIRTIKRLRKAIDAAEQYIEADELTVLDDDEENIVKLKKLKEQMKKRFRAYN